MTIPRLSVVPSADSHRKVATTVNQLLSTTTRYQGLLSVKGFGAKGDSDATGTTGTDDTAAIQAALDAGAGGIVFFPKGSYKHTTYLTVPPFTTLLGEGNNSSLLVSNYAGGGGANAGENLRNGSALVQASPINSSTITRLRLDGIGIINSNSSNVGAAFYDTCSSEFSIHACAFGGFKYGVVLDQSELVDIDLCSFASQNANGAGLWLVNGADLTPGVIAGFTNRISWKRCQFNEGATVICVQDDGGSAHVDEDNNFNGGLNHRRICGAFPITIRGGEHEGAAGDSTVLTNLKPTGSSVGGPLVSVHGGLYSVAAGKASIAGQGTSAGFLQVDGVPEFSGGAGTTAITGSSRFSAIVLVTYVLNTSATSPKDGEALFVDIDFNNGGQMLFSGAFSINRIALDGGDIGLASGKVIKVNGTQVITARQTGTAANATDLATAITLVNDLKTKLIAHGLIS